VLFLLNTSFEKAIGNADFVQEKFAEKFPETPAVYRDRPLTLNELKAAITAFIRTISHADLQKVFANKIKLVQACIDARGHHLQHLL
jgi:hypothetical protein